VNGQGRSKGGKGVPRPHAGFILTKFQPSHPNMDVKYSWGWVKLVIFNKYALYLRNDMRYEHSYYGILLEGHMLSIGWYHHFQRLLLTHKTPHFYILCRPSYLYKESLNLIFWLKAASARSTDDTPCVKGPVRVERSFQLLLSSFCLWNAWNLSNRFIVVTTTQCVNPPQTDVVRVTSPLLLFSQTSGSPL